MAFFRSVTSLFSGQTNASSSTNNRRTAMNTTFDAFRLPTTSRYDNGGLGTGMEDGHIDSASSSPGPSRRGSTSYTYPPPRDTYQPSSNLYPPLSHTFHRLRRALAETFPELLETLNGPVDPNLLASFERELGCPLPPAVRECFIIADGQDIDSGCAGLFFGLYLLPLEDVMREWAFWRQAEHDPQAGGNPAILATMASIPPAWIKHLYACRGWLPLLSDRTGNYVGVDLDPGPGGSRGQVIVFGRDFDRKVVLWRGDGEGGWGKWLASFVDELESGEGWEADKSNSSDEDEDVGYGSYNGGATYGESGKGLKLAGEYKGWNVLEAWWDRSVSHWEQLGMGMDVLEIERGLSEARRLTGMEGKDDSDKVQARGGESVSQVEIPVYGSPHIPQAPSTPVPHDSDVLLPPSSPDHPALQPPRFKNPAKIPVRIITPITSASDHHPLQPEAGPSHAAERDLGAGYLSPPDHRRAKFPPPAPTSLDLPTRADVQAMAAIAKAETSGLRGGWVMNLDPGIAARRQYGTGGAGDSEMVDIDLEGGKGEKFGSPRMSAEDVERQREEEKLAYANLEQRRSPQLISSRTPSPLSMSRANSLEIPGASGSGGSSNNKTPRASSQNEAAGGTTPVPASVLAATSALRRPPPVANHSESTLRGRNGVNDDERDKEVLRARPLRGERESSVISMDSEDGLLSARSIPSRSASPVLGSPVASPTTITGPRSSAEYNGTGGDTGNQVEKEGIDGLEEELEEVSLTDGGGLDVKAGGGVGPLPGGLREVRV